MTPLSVLRQAEQAAQNLPRGWVVLTAAAASWLVVLVGGWLMAMGIWAVVRMVL